MSEVQCDSRFVVCRNTASGCTSKLEHSWYYRTSVMSLFCAFHSHLLMCRRQTVRIPADAVGLQLRTTTLGKVDGKRLLSRGNGAKKRGTGTATSWVRSRQCFLEAPKHLHKSPTWLCRHRRAGEKEGKGCQPQTTWRMIENIRT